MVKEPDHELLQDIQQAREMMRKNEPLPPWTEFEWVSAIVAQLGKCAVPAGVISSLLMTAPVDELQLDKERRDFRTQLIGVVAVMFDALEEVDHRLSTEHEGDRLEAFAHMARIMSSEGYGRKELADVIEEVTQ